VTGSEKAAVLAARLERLSRLASRAASEQGARLRPEELTDGEQLRLLARLAASRVSPLVRR
jgi:hypothetical protein